MSAAVQAATLIARFQHANESLHRHNSDGETCTYCDLVGKYAVRTLLGATDVLEALVAEIDGDTSRTVRPDGVWLAYYSDWSGFWVFATEIEALRHAVESQCNTVFLPFGADPHEVDRQQYAHLLTNEEETP